MASTRRVIKGDVQHMPNDAVLDVDCFFNVYQLIVGSMVRRADSLADAWGFQQGYARTMSALLHIWRDRARCIFQAWHAALPLTSNLVRNMPPVLISGRWGSVATCEKFLLQVPSRDGQIVLEGVMAGALTKARKKSKKSVGARAEDDYAKAMSKNKRIMASLLPRYPIWHDLVRIHHAALDPLHEFYHWLLKHESARLPFEDYSAKGAIAMLVCHKAEYFDSRFDAALNNDIWDDILDSAPLTMKDTYVNTILFLVLACAAWWHWRVGKKTTKGFLGHGCISEG